MYRIREHGIENPGLEGEQIEMRGNPPDVVEDATRSSEAASGQTDSEIYGGSITSGVLV